MSVSNVSTASSNQPITPLHNTPVCGSAAAAAVAATVLGPSVAAGSASPVCKGASPEQAITSTSEFNETPIERLPNEMILPMMMHLSVKEVVRMREVDTRFRDIGGDALVDNICNKNIPLVKLGLQGNAKILAFLNSLSSENRIRIKQLNLLSTGVDNTFLAELSSLTPNLQGLDLAFCCHIDDHGLQLLAPLTQLRNLSFLECSYITDHGSLQHLAPFAELRSLNFLGCYKITDDGLIHLAPFNKLENLNLSNCYKIRDRGLQQIALLTQLRSLSLNNCSQITNAGLRHLAPLTELQRLNLGGWYEITDDGLNHLAPFQKLEILSLRSCFQITNRGIQLLVTLIKKLRCLNLDGCSRITIYDNINRCIPGLTVFDSELHDSPF